MRWNGPLGDWTLLDGRDARTVAPFHSGDILSATEIGNTITVSINGAPIFQVNDSTYQGGSPGIGFYDNADSNWANFGFSDFSASNVGGGPPPPPPPVDTTPPQLTSLSPADNATNVATNANLVLTFNEAVVPGAGTIVIHNSKGNAAAFWSTSPR